MYRCCTNNSRRSCTKAVAILMLQVVLLVSQVSQTQSSDLLTSCQLLKCVSLASDLNDVTDSSVSQYHYKLQEIA